MDGLKSNMEFERRIKGQITESLVQTLLEHAGYRVVPLGIEQVIREVKDQGSWNLPQPLRTLPDFLITDAEIKKNWLLEVKYRHQWNEYTIKSLEETLTNQVKYWSEFYFLVFLGNCDGGKVTTASRSGIFHLTHREGKLGYLNKGQFYPWKNAEWKFSSRIHTVFEDLKELYEAQTIKKCCEIVDKYSEILVSYK